MVVNNSTNINKTNNHLSHTESLNSDGQQFHQYQQNQQSPLILTRWTQQNRRSQHGPDLGQAYMLRS
jgi:hypothetical protein